MKLTVRDAARVLSVPESQVYRWVDDGEIPCYLVNHQPLFSPAELLEWATSRRLPVLPQLFESDDDDNAARPPRLAEALARGGIHREVRGGDRQSAMKAVVERLPVPDEADREVLLQVLLAREALGSTGIGEGLAIPHVRTPLVFPGVQAAAALCFLETPVPFAAIDGRPVHTIFVLLTPTIRGHLQLLSRLSLALLDRGFKEAVLGRAPTEKILDQARRIDAAHPDRSARSAETSHR